VTSETGIVGAALGGVAGAAKVVQGGAMAVERGAKFASKASKVAKRIERDVGNVEKMGAKFVANPNMHDALRYKGAISHMVRAKSIRPSRPVFPSETTRVMNSWACRIAPLHPRFQRNPS
jgi:hypothetical protein